MVEEAQTTIEPRMSQEEFIQLCQETLNTARTIEALLRGLNNGYEESLNALQNLKTELHGYINGFYDNTAELENRLQTAREEIADVLSKIEEIKPQMEAIYELSQSTETSLARLEEINTNVTQIEQSIKEAVASINLDEVRNVGEEIKNTLAQSLKETAQEKLDEILETIANTQDELIKGAEAIKEQVFFLIEERTREIQRLGEYSIEQIEKAKRDALDAIGAVATTGRTELLLEYDAILLFSRVTLNKVKIDRERYNKIGMEAVFHTSSYPSSYVPLGAELTTKDYPILYKKSGVKAVGGKFTIGLPKENTYIYTGKGV